jgi:site-specific recombinase XerD
MGRAPLSAAGYQRMVARAGVAAKFTFPVHSHMLRHACGFKLANDGHDTRAIQAYLGHHSLGTLPKQGTVLNWATH